MTLVVIGIAVLLTLGTYWGLERLPFRAWLPVLSRAVAWSCLGILLLNVSCPAPDRGGSPLLLVDASLSMASDSSAWRALIDSLGAERDLAFFGDERGVRSSPDLRGVSRLGPALGVVAGATRPVVLLTDGELEDTGDLPADLLAGIQVVQRRRPDTVPVAVTEVQGPRRVIAGDTIVVEGEVRSFGPSTAPGTEVRLRSGETVLAQAPLTVPARGRTRFRLATPSGRLAPGDHVFTVELDGTSGEATPAVTRQVITSVVATPGVVLLADPGDWDARFLFGVLGEVADLPVRGFVRITDGWLEMETLRPVSESRVNRATRSAELLLLKGQASLPPGSRARGVLRWPSGEQGQTQLVGEWYVSAPLGSPLSASLVGAPLDSFPPTTQITPIQPDSGEWVGLVAQEGRRGALRPVVIGAQRSGRRSILVATDGLWRWAFSGGASEQAYRAWVATSVTWLLGGADSGGPKVFPVRRVVPRARPVVFRWAGPGQPDARPIILNSPDTTMVDTLDFDGGGLARLWLEPGSYRYQIGEARGTVAVETYTNELLPGLVTLQPREAVIGGIGARMSAREALWLFGLAVLALAIEWLTRRRIGLR